MVAPSEPGKFEDVKALVLKSLESTGTLAQIRAQLRVCVFKAIENKSEDKESAGSSPFSGNPAQKLRSINLKTGVLLAELVAEFLDFYGFKHSLSVFLPESQLGRTRRGRSETAADAGIKHVGSDSSIIEQVLATSKHEGSDGVASPVGATRPTDVNPRAASWSRLPPLSDPPNAKKLGANTGEHALPVSPPVSPGGRVADGDRRGNADKNSGKDKEKEKDQEKKLVVDPNTRKERKQEVEETSEKAQLKSQLAQPAAIAKDPTQLKPSTSSPTSKKPEAESLSNKKHEAASPSNKKQDAKEANATSADAGDSLGSMEVDEVLSEVDEEIATSSAISGASISAGEDLGFGGSDDLGSSDPLDGGTSKLLPPKGAQRTRKLDALEKESLGSNSASAVLDGVSVDVDISVDSQEIENCDHFERVIVPSK